MEEVWDGLAVLVVEWPQPLLPELSPATPYVEILGQPQADEAHRRWFVRGVPELPETWLELTTKIGE